MADVAGCRTVGFSVTPDSVTVVTSVGNNVTLVDTGVEEILGVNTMVGITNNGAKYPLVANYSDTPIAIGVGWDYDNGVNVGQEQLECVCVINGDNEYENPLLLPWLVQCRGYRR